jgi:PhoPQ-activated pathogenicity-related protein/acetyl esterase/lipase
VRKFAAKYLSTFFRPRKTSLRRGTKKRNQQFCALDFEQLEQRRVLASFGFTPQFGVDVTSDIVYRDDAQVGHGTPQGVTEKELKLDLYKPTGNGLPALLPGAIVIHGGGFVGGDKAAGNFIDLSNDFASRGYVTASINYRLYGDNPPPAKETQFSGVDDRYDTFVAGVEDAFHAIKWMKDNAESMGIDPERIVLGGHSAGGFLSLATGMYDTADVNTFSYMDLDVSTLEVAAILDGAGSLKGTEYTIDPSDPPTFVLHSEDDATVTYDNALAVVSELVNDNIAHEFPRITTAGHSLDSKLDTVIDGVLVSDQMFAFFQQQLDLGELETTTWSLGSSSNYIAEADQNQTVTVSLDGALAENDSVSVRIATADITTTSNDYLSPQQSIANAVDGYNGPGTLLYSLETGELTYTGGQGGTSMGNLVIAAQPVNDSSFEYTESLSISLNNPGSNTGNLVNISEGASAVTLNILDDDGTALDSYVAAPDLTYEFSLESTIAGQGFKTYVVDMTSQSWRSSEEVDKPIWKHWVEIVVPDGVTSDTAILHISGGNSANAPSSTNQAALQLALSTNQITVSVSTVPNQPLLFAGENTARQEDAIIAYSFDKYLDGGDDQWPVLLPMVKSAVRAMDTAQEFLQTNEQYNVTEFYVTGGSKRGWTTWLTAASDPRVSGIAPVVFDYLNAEASVEFHEHVYADVEEGVFGGYAEAVFDYYQMGVFERMGTPRSDLLVEMVDPYSYRDRLTMPKFAINSAGDQFMPMASRYYIQEMSGPTYVRYMPNTGHSTANQGVAEFFSVLEVDGDLPEFTWQFDGIQENTIRLNVADKPVSIKKWQATNPNNLDFRIDYFGDNWTSTQLNEQPSGEYLESVTVPQTGGTAFFLELVYEVGNETLVFTTDATIVEAQTRELTLDISNPSVVESAGASAATATVTRDSDVSQSLVVLLTSDDISELVIPPSIVIPAGATTSWPFNIGAVDDDLEDGTQTVTITAQANLYQDSSALVQVEDDDEAQTNPWHNENLPEDVNNDGIVSPLDALHVINELNQNGSYELPESKPDGETKVDVNGDGWLSPADAIQVINTLNADDDSLSFELFLTDVNGEMITNANLNEVFFINLGAEDLTPEAAGVFAAYVDLYLPETHLEFAGNAVFESPFENGKSGTATEQGMLDEWGAFASLEKTGSGRLLISRIPVRAIRTGSVLAILDPADVTPLHDVLIYDRELAISVEDIRYQSLEFEILDHAEGESTDEIDEVFASY